MARGGREKRCVLPSQQSARIRDRSDHHRCLYCDDVPAERPHRDGPLCRRPVSQCVPAFRARADGGQEQAWNTRLRGTEVVDLAEAEAARDDLNLVLAGSGRCRRWSPSSPGSLRSIRSRAACSGTPELGCAQAARGAALAASRNRGLAFGEHRGRSAGAAWARPQTPAARSAP